MKITKNQLIKMIKEELSSIKEASDEDKISKLLNSEHLGMVKQGMELASMLGMPIVMQKPVPYRVLKFIESIDDPDLLTSLANPQTDRKIQARVARNQFTPIEIIHKIATDEEYNIRAANYAAKSLRLYCKQHPDEEICNLSTRFK